MSEEGSMLYIGSWNDFEITNYYPEVKKFVFIDGQPRTEYTPENGKEKYEPDMYRSRFIEQIMKSSEENGFTRTSTKIVDHKYMDKIMNLEEKRMNKLPHLNPEKWIFENELTGQIIYYHISTSVPVNVGEELENDIQTCDKLFISGYNPSAFFLKSIKKPFTLIGSIDTYYELDEDDEFGEDKIFYQLEKNLEVVSMIHQYELIDKEDKQKIKVNNFKEIQKVSHQIWKKHFGDDSDDSDDES